MLIKNIDILNAHIYICKESYFFLLLQGLRMHLQEVEKFFLLCRNLQCTSNCLIRPFLFNFLISLLNLHFQRAPKMCDIISVGVLHLFIKQKRLEKMGAEIPCKLEGTVFVQRFHSSDRS